MSFTAKEVKDLIEKFEENNEEYHDDYGGIYDYLMDEEEPVSIDGLGEVKHVESFGGEGQGDDYWVVFSVGDQLFRVNGYYASYDGGELDGEVEEVFPKQVVVTQYESRK